MIYIIGFYHQLCDIIFFLSSYIWENCDLAHLITHQCQLSRKWKSPYLKENWNCIFLKLNYIMGGILQTFLTKMHPLLKPHARRKKKKKSLLTSALEVTWLWHSQSYWPVLTEVIWLHRWALALRQLQSMSLLEGRVHYSPYSGPTGMPSWILWVHFFCVWLLDRSCPFASLQNEG